MSSEQNTGMLNVPNGSLVIAFRNGDEVRGVDVSNDFPFNGNAEDCRLWFESAWMRVMHPALNCLFGDIIHAASEQDHAATPESHT